MEQGHGYVVSFYGLIWKGSVGLLLLFIIHLFYNAYLHPLRRYPGPKLWASTRLVWTYHDLCGTLTFTLASLHSQYGPVIRIAPNELSYTTAAAWRDIYGIRSDLPNGEMTKDLRGVGLPPPMMDEGPGIANAADKATHARFRKRLAPAFSDRAMRDFHEPVLKTHVKRLVEGLRGASMSAAEDGKVKVKPLNIVNWYNWLSFDIVSDLTFGTDVFGSLQNQHYHPWVSNVFQAIKSFAWLHLAMYLGILPLLKWITPGQLTKAYDETLGLVRREVDRRLDEEKAGHAVVAEAVASNNEKENDPYSAAPRRKGDFVSYLAGAHTESIGTEPVTRREMYMNCAHLLAAGSETTATALSGLTYFLLRNPAVYKRLVQEIRDAFKGEEGITIQSSAELVYLDAVIEETLRMYPPAAGSMPRVVPNGGARIDGEWVPAATTVSVHQYSTNHSPSNFHSPDTFLPARWLPSTNTTTTTSPTHTPKSFNPFSHGPRNCIGKNLAYAELRLTVCYVFFNFEVEFADPEGEEERLGEGGNGSGGWLRQKAWLAWEKGELMVLVKERERTSGMGIGGL